MKYGLDDSVIEKICSVFARFPVLEKAVLYGSRAKGNYREGSDIDLTLYGDDLSEHDLFNIADALDDLLLPYMFDLSIFSNLDHAKLREHIERVGIVFYKKGDVIGWDEVSIGLTCQVIAGQSPEGKFYNNQGIGLPFYQGKKNFGDKFIQPADVWTSEITKEAIAGDILMSVRAPVGPINFSTDRVCIGRGLAAIRAGSRVNKDFLFYLLLSKQSEITGNKGAVFDSINKNQIEQIRYFLPPIPEQKRIVGILDEAFEGIDAAIANTEKNLANTSELFRSVFKNLFELPDRSRGVEELSHYCEFIVDCEHKTAPIQGEGIPSIRTPNVGFGKLILDGVNRVSGETYKLWTRRGVPQAGDLILAREAPAGNVAVIQEGEKVCLGQRTVLIRPKADKFHSKYLAYFLLHPIIQIELLGHSKGATVQHINMKDIRAFPVGQLLGIDNQINISNQIDNLISSTEIISTGYKNKIQNLSNLKQSLLQKAFRGELTSEADALAEVAA